MMLIHRTVVGIITIATSTGISIGIPKARLHSSSARRSVCVVAACTLYSSTLDSSTCFVVSAARYCSPDGSDTSTDVY